jgi:hypothetical protein
MYGRRSATGGCVPGSAGLAAEKKKYRGEEDRKKKEK